MLPAVGQAIIGVEIRSNDQVMREIALQINHAETMEVASIEREYLESLEASCNSPVAAYAQIRDRTIHADFLYADYDMTFYQTFSADIDSDTKYLGKQAAQYLKYRCS